ncbi:MAG: hypothetical protein Greene101449_205 [Candidatus Peregrinibacteria bacterium Greene1014_49]|nr:MAG: hypothetical protein Greene101449_205 [Candidatus Peregrinibacteria bacterium Greene1014_49]
MEIFVRFAAPLLAVIGFVLADWFSVKWFESGNIYYLPIIATLAVFAYWLFGWVSSATSLSITSGLINTGIVIGSIAMGLFLRNDTLDLQQKIGLILAVLAVGLITIHR